MGAAMDRERVIAGLKEFFRSRGGVVVAAYLYGSVARGESPESRPPLSRSCDARS